MKTSFLQLKHRRPDPEQLILLEEVMDCEHEFFRICILAAYRINRSGAIGTAWPLCAVSSDQAIDPAHHGGRAVH